MLHYHKLVGLDCKVLPIFFMHYKLYASTGVYVCCALLQYLYVFQMDDVLEKFLEDQKMKIAEEKACLEQEPPYMEMRVRERELVMGIVKMCLIGHHHNVV